MTDLTYIPAPKLVTEKTSDEVLQERLANLESQGVDIDNFTPSDPLYRNQLAASYRESLVIQTVNDQANAVLLAKATEQNLDHIGNFPLYELERLDGESDDDYQERLKLSLEGASAAGPSGRYELAARSASLMVKKAKFISPEPMIGNVYVLSRENDGTASAELLVIVQNAITADGIRAQGDVMTALSADIVSYAINAELVIAEGPDKAQVLAYATERLQSYVDKQHMLGGRVTPFKASSALDVEGVNDVNLNGFAGINCNDSQAPYCMSLQVTEQL